MMIRNSRTILKFVVRNEELIRQAVRMASTAPPTEIGFVGVGNMGSLMSKHLLDKGHRVTVFDLNKSAVDNLVKKGAKEASSVAEIGETCKRVFTMLPTPGIISNTCIGPDGLLSKASSSTVFVDSSTIDPGTAQTIHKSAAAEKIKLFDAPVAGAVPAAKAGTLVFMVGVTRRISKNCSNHIQLHLHMWSNWFRLGSKNLQQHDASHLYAWPN